MNRSQLPDRPAVPGTVVRDTAPSTAKGAGKPEGLEILTLGDLLADTSPPPPAVIGNGILLDNTLLMIVGPPKSGKSLLAANLSLAIAAGKGFAVFPIAESRKVLMLSGEGGYYPNRDRIQAMARRYPDIKLEHFLYPRNPIMKFNDEKDVEMLGGVLEAYEPDVLVVDPLICFHTLRENNSEEMGYLMSVIRGLINDFEISAILVHHTGKNEQLGPRGSSTLAGAYDSCLQIERGKDRCLLKYDMRHVATPPDSMVRFNPATYWFEQIGDDPLLQLIAMSKEPEIRSALADRAVQAGLYKHPPAVYKRIDKLIENGALRLDDHERISIVERSPVSYSPGE